VSLTAGEFDLSVASVMGFAATMVAFLNVNHHWAIIPAIIAGLVLGLLGDAFTRYVAFEPV